MKRLGGVESRATNACHEDVVAQEKTKSEKRELLSRQRDHAADRGIAEQDGGEDASNSHLPSRIRVRRTSTKELKGPEEPVDIRLVGMETRKADPAQYEDHAHEDECHEWANVAPDRSQPAAP
jgi:hypothetical protein